MIVRFVIVGALVAALFAVHLAYREWQRRVHADDRPVPRVPADVLAGGLAGTWIVFTTPYCATCEPVAQLLGTSYPDTPVVKVDVTDRPDLARDFRIARAPTVVRADGSGDVEARLVGPEAVTEYVRANRPVREPVS